jgi:UDP-N-acetylenolpyruvoylglucosamine reductase
MLEYLQKNKEITKLSNFKTKAFTEFYFEIHNLDDVDKLKEIVNFADKQNLKILFVGAGTNMLFAFENYK